MQVVRRKTAAVFLKLPDIGRDRNGQRHHSALYRQLVGLAKIAGTAGGDDILPCGAPAARSWDDMVEG